MSVSVQGLKFNYFGIERLSGGKVIDLTNSILFADYFEDLLSPCVTMVVKLISSSSLLNTLPIRGGEKVSMSIETVFGEFIFDDENAFYVYKVSDISPNDTNEIITLNLVSREAFTNETVRCEKKYKNATIDTHVKDILEKTLNTKKIGTIEKTANKYSFIGNNKKPFHVLTWLSPKSVPFSSKKTGVSGDGETGKALGTAGYLFYENQDGFNFRSIESLVSSTQIGSSSSNSKDIQQFSFTGAIQSGIESNERRIIQYNLDKNIDLMKSLRVGMYSNKTYFYDLYENTFDVYSYNLKEQIQNKMGSNDLDVFEFGDRISRLMVKVSDRGAFAEDGDPGEKDYSSIDMSKSFSRYNLLFTQALNMVVPCNITLKVGDVIYAEFPKIESSNTKSVDEEQSGIYLIQQLRHHFEGNHMSTSMRLIRDSYGLYNY